MKKSLPVVQASSLNVDGSRNYVHPADVSGRFTLRRYVVFAVLIVVYLALPFVHVGGRPAVFLDVVHRRFYLFGAAFNAQDFWLVFFLLTGIALVLFVMTTLWGRIWCGYACPQTVFLEGVYRRVERWIEGPRNQRMKRNAGPMTGDKLWRKGLKHLLYVLISLFFSHFFLSYFVSLPSLAQMVGRSPAEHPAAFGWMLAMTTVLYFNFSWFREQMCLIVCPYGRLQSTLTDRDTLVIGYDEERGEPRGKKSKRATESRGDCVDCLRCVHVCPTGIDIRNGLQMECIGCAACVDACDQVMEKLGRAPGLVRYDSLNGFDQKPKRTARGRLALYAAVTLIWLGVAFGALRSHESYEANILRPPGGVPFVVADGFVRNTVQIHVVNKTDAEQVFALRGLGELEYVLPMAEVELDAGEGRHVPVIVRVPEADMRSGLVTQIELAPADGDSRVLEAPFLGPGGGS